MISAELLSPASQIIGWLLYLPLLFWALLRAPWLELVSDLRRQHILGGTALALFLLVLLTEPAFNGMSENAWLISGLTAWMALWWITEPVPIPVTALLPIVVVPLLSLDSIGNVTAPYAHPLIFLFLGGFMLSIAMERWNLHKRIALLTMLLVGSKPSQQVAGIMLVTAFLSMWMSNTATAVMMLPIGLSIIAMQQEQGISEDNFAKAILLAIAYAASIGGVATLIGTPPNALLAAYLERSYQLQLSFSDWMLFGVPLSASLLLVCWFWLTQLHFRLDKVKTIDSRSLYRQKLNALGAMHNAEKLVLLVFILAAGCWIFRSPLSSLSGIKLDDTLIDLDVPDASPMPMGLPATADTMLLTSRTILLLGASQ